MIGHIRFGASLSIQLVECGSLLNAKLSHILDISDIANPGDNLKLIISMSSWACTVEPAV
jgi:hypothetical protein